MLAFLVWVYRTTLYVYNGSVFLLIWILTSMFPLSGTLVVQLSKTYKGQNFERYYAQFCQGA